MKHEITHEFTTPTEFRNDIKFRLRNTEIFHKVMVNPDENTPGTPGIAVYQGYAGTYTTNLCVVIPLNQVDKFCEEIKAFAAQMSKITNNDHA